MVRDAGQRALVDDHVVEDLVLDDHLARRGRGGTPASCACADGPGRRAPPAAGRRARSCGTSVRKPSEPRFTPRMGTGRPAPSARHESGCRRRRARGPARPGGSSPPRRRPASRSLPRARPRRAARGRGTAPGPRGRGPTASALPRFATTATVFTLGGSVLLQGAPTDGPLRPRQSSARPPTRGPLAERMRPTSLEELVGPGAPDRRGPPPAPGDRGGPAALAHPLGAPGHRQDHPGPGHRAARRGAAFVADLGGARRGEGHPRGGRAGRGARAAARPAHRPLRRRDPPLQQGAAGRAPAARGEGHPHPARRHHREPVASR